MPRPFRRRNVPGQSDRDGVWQHLQLDRQGRDSALFKLNIQLSDEFLERC